MRLPFTLAFISGCSGVAAPGGDPGVAASASAVAPPFVAAGAGSAPANVNAPPNASAATPRPELTNFAARDRNHNLIDDELEHPQAATQRVDIQVILLRPAQGAELAAFALHDGHVDHVFSAVSYGWSGSLPRANLKAVRDELGAALHFIAAPRGVVPLLDEATRTGRARPVWAGNFAGAGSGFLGNANITIGVIDTGVDDTHPDLAGNSAGFKDFSADLATQARDVQAHGTHVTSIAVGTGAAFGVGPGTLRYTNTGALSGLAAGSFSPAPIHTPAYFNAGAALMVSSTASWVGSQTGLLRAAQASDPNGTWVPFGPMASGISPRSLPSAATESAQARYSDALMQGNPAGIAAFAVANRVANYPAVGDGFNALSGVAPRCRWFGAKVFTDQGHGSSSSTGAALDFLVQHRVEMNVKVLNLSLGSLGGTDENLRGMVNSAVDHGVVVVVSAGNGGPSGTVSDPGRAGKVISVGATNDLNELTSYTSSGAAVLDNDGTEDLKPDLLAPGGSSYRSLILAADSNSADAEDATFPDIQADDYRGQQGTSMAAPFVAGASGLLIDALQRSGAIWDFTSSASAFRVKMLLLASATETNKNREQDFGGSPTLGRAGALMDVHEGFGILNPDAAIEAITLPLPASFSGVINDSPVARAEWERRAWGRRVSLRAADVLGLTLNPATTADLDLYLYSETPDKFGNPVLRAASANVTAGAPEQIQYTARVAETAYVFVKRVSGFGDFILTSTHRVPCGNGVLDPGEACDPSVPHSETCCDASCNALGSDTLCDDGDACSIVDRCQEGVCVGAGFVECAPPGECQTAGRCDPINGQCSDAAAITDNVPCSLGTCQLGVCQAQSASGDGGAAGEGGAAARAEAGTAGDGGRDTGTSGTLGGGASGSESDTDADRAGASPSSAGGTSAAAGTAAESGCGCSIVGSGRRAGSAFWVMAGVSLLSLRRRRFRLLASARFGTSLKGKL
ncbi:MAG: S8 family serine peptidase [Pseudomonadota bacterium]